jgi:hypothetical protein
VCRLDNRVTCVPEEGSFFVYLRDERRSGRGWLFGEEGLLADAGGDLGEFAFEGTDGGRFFSRGSPN